VNEKQKKVLIVVGLSVLAMLLFPPFQWEGANGATASAGYGFLFNPPGGAVDIGTLFTQWIGVLIVGGIAFFLMKND
jgi:hypothetical protein